MRTLFEKLQDIKINKLKMDIERVVNFEEIPKYKKKPNVIRDIERLYKKIK